MLHSKTQRQRVRGLWPRGSYQVGRPSPRAGIRRHPDAAARRIRLYVPLQSGDVGHLCALVWPFYFSCRIHLINNLLSGGSFCLHHPSPPCGFPTTIRKHHHHCCLLATLDIPLREPPRTPLHYGVLVGGCDEITRGGGGGGMVPFNAATGHCEKNSR